MSRRLVLLGPYPPPYGGVSIYISTLFKFLKNHGAELWTYGDQRISEPGVFFLKDRRRQLPWLLVRRGSPSGSVLFEGTLEQGHTMRFAPRVWVRLGAPWNVAIKRGAHVVTENTTLKPNPCPIPAARSVR